MIAVTYSGWNPAGLIAYLLGPGRYEEHVNPRVVAGSLSPALLNPVDVTVAAPSSAIGDPSSEADGGGTDEGKVAPTTGGSKWNDVESIAWLSRYLETGVAEAGLPLRNPAPDSYWYGREGYVWHTPVRLHPNDRVLDDATWAHIAQRLIDTTGIGPAGCRWVAVRHGDDHIHLAAVLVHRRGETWKRFHPKWWKRRMREECTRIEAELGLRPTPAAAPTTAPAPTKGELRKAARLGYTAPRLWLRRELSQIAAAVRGPAEFEAALRQHGIRLRYRRSRDDRVIGYSVAAPHSGADPVYFSGTKLAPDLTWPQLLRRWNTIPTDTSAAPRREERHAQLALDDNLTEATSIVRQATAQIRDNPPQSPDMPAIAYAAGELLQTAASGERLGTASDIDGTYSVAANTFAPLARQGAPTHQPNPLAQVSRQLRALARLLATLESPPLSGTGDGYGAAGAQFALALAALIAEIGAWHYDHQHYAHVLTADSAVTHLRTHARARPAQARPPAVPAPRQEPANTQQTRTPTEQRGRRQPEPRPHARPDPRTGPPGADPRRPGGR